MKQKGFTLLELLAVIVVLAIIALIATPIVIKVIDSAEKGAFEDTAYGLISAAKIYYAESSFDGQNKQEVFTFPGDKKLKVSGNKPDGGNLVLDENGKIEMAIHNNKWCVVKGKEEGKVTVKAYKDGECKIDGIEIPEEPTTPETCFTVNTSDPSEITGYTCTDSDVIIPRTINGVEIKKIGQYAMGGGSYVGALVTSVILPDTITSIENYAFQYSQLTSINIPDSVTVIGGGAFMSSQLQNITLSKNLVSIGESAFAYNEITSVDIPNSVTTIGNTAFYYNQISHLSIPKSVTHIGVGAFTSNQLPDSEAFIYQRNSDGTENKSELNSYAGARTENIGIPSNVTKIGNLAFMQCNIPSIVIPSGVTDIGNQAFEYNQMKSVVIPNTVTNIGAYAFQFNQLTQVNIPSSVTSIGKSAFWRNATNMKVIINKPEGSLDGSPWGAGSVEWTG